VKRLETVVNDYNDVDVWENAEGGIDFDVIGATHATWHPTRLLTGHAWDALTGAALLHPETPASVLMLGLGGGTVLRQLRHFLPDTRLTAVEIDGDMIRLARTYMALDSLQVDVIHKDAFEFLARDTQPFDVVIDDLYRCGDQDVERPQEITESYIDTLCRHLSPQGTLVMNFVVAKGHRNIQQQGRQGFQNRFTSYGAVKPPLSHNEAQVGTFHPNGLRDISSLRRTQSLLSEPSDRKQWKELRFLQLP
jgi:spermidine synthase